MNILVKLSLILMICSFSYGCSANERSSNDDLLAIEKKLKKMLPESIQINSINATDIKGYYEVNFEGVEPLYVTADGNYLISGDIYLITEEGLVNKSEARRDFQRKALLEGIDVNQFIIFEPKEVKHNVFVFTDVDCGYCRQFHNQIQEYLDLGIKVNYLAYPRAGIGSDSYRRIVSAWCADDPNYSLTVLKQGGEIKDNVCSTNPVENHFNLGRSIGVQGTPSIVTQEGKMIPGYLPPEELLNLLSANS